MSNYSQLTDDDVFRVVVVDDHEMILESIVRLLAADSRIIVVGTALNATEGIEVVREVLPDVLVIDYHLPDMDAPEAIKLIREFDPQVKVVTLSGSDRPASKYAASNAGSSMWVRKTRAIHELIDAILLVANDEPNANDERRLQPTLDELVVHYQPIVRFDNDTIVGLEALVRWQHPQYGLLNPDSFLPLALETGFIDEVDRWVREQAFRQLVRWQRQFPSVPHLWMSVNLPDNAVVNPWFVESLSQVIANTGVNAKDIMVEINESVLLDDPESTFEFLSQLNRVGVRLALENFGSSFSPIAYIHRVPFFCLKIDRSFTAELPQSVGTTWLIECIAKFAGSMGMMCVVEGIERVEQLNSVRDMGLSVGQGSMFASPVSAKDCEVLLTNASQSRATRANVNSPLSVPQSGSSPR
jgi:EAL domain-containing protein (putative c-di-GMP-specific phosphodiesterase class I)